MSTAQSIWTCEGFRRATRGRWLVKPGLDTPDPEAVSIDTRTLRPGEAFIALRGDHFDGHAFLAAAITAGASLLIIDSPDALIEPVRQLLDTPGGPAVLSVGDTHEALMDLANAHRANFSRTYVIAVTGSAGKTTTVRLIDAALRTTMVGSSSKNSFNNAIGVPLTILSASETDQYLICEAGMSTPGEIETLSQLIQPDIAVITRVGHAHIGAFKDGILGVAREKASIFQHLAINGLGIVPADEANGSKRLAPHLAPVPRLRTFGTSPGSTVFIENIEQITTPAQTPGLRFTIGGQDDTPVTIPLPGVHNAYNAAAALEVATELGVRFADAAAGLMKVDLPRMRTQIEHLGCPDSEEGVRIVNDAYNASPESVAASLATFADLASTANRRVLVLGDMLELGSYSEQAHRNIAHAIQEHGLPDLLVVVGEHALNIADELSHDLPHERVLIFSQMSADIATRIAARFEEGDAVLLKASRSIGLERVLEAAKQRFTRSLQAGPSEGDHA